jgi:gentisate 1,2-dioxygenase
MSDFLLKALEQQLAGAQLRGQWQSDANRPQNVVKQGGALRIEPIPSGSSHVWSWKEIEPLLGRACEAMPESLSARRALVLTNPGLQRGTTHTLLASMQIVRPGEIAWSHRHAINALRFSIKGAQGVFTVVEGRELAMEPYDLILTPGWTWHDHHNETSEDAVWLDALDVPFTLALNQQFYEETGDVTQPSVSDDQNVPLFRGYGQTADAAARPYRYPWKLMRERLELGGDVDPRLGLCVDYINPVSGSSVLPTIACRIHVLPPGFEGAFFRTTASEIAFVVEGEGTVAMLDTALEWRTHDCLALANWTQRRFINRSRRDRAILFVISDSPILSAFGFLRNDE